jgi:glyoxylase-like metal-dependent hydrolase (beta-lactamase superfamily II)
MLLLQMKLRASIRRGAVVFALLFVAVPVFTPFAIAQVAAPKLSQSQAGFYRMKVGDFEITALSDGTVPLPVFDLLTNVKPVEIERLLSDAFVKAPLDASVNAFLIKPPGNTNKLMMVDAGSGELYGPTLNKLVASLKAAGYEPEQITDILITHIHTDHSGGLMDGSRMVFPNAVVHADKREVDYWLNPDNRDKSKGNKEQLVRLFREAAAKVKPYLDAGKVKTFDGDTQMFPGIRSIATPGHTPGHSFYSIESKGEKIVFLGDIMHVAEVQFPNPAVTIVFDSDSKAAAAQRKKAFADAAKNGYWIAPAHVSFPGVGHLRAEGSGYKWIPIAYVNDAYETGKQ